MVNSISLETTLSPKIGKKRIDDAKIPANEGSGNSIPLEELHLTQRCSRAIDCNAHTAPRKIHCDAIYQGNDYSIGGTNLFRTERILCNDIANQVCIVDSSSLEKICFAQNVTANERTRERKSSYQDSPAVRGKDSEMV